MNPGSKIKPKGINDENTCQQTVRRAGTAGALHPEPSALHRAFAQSYSIDWHKIAGGGGTSTGSVYAVSGTIRQPDASGAMTGGNYSLTGGFWSLISVVQTAGLPNLSITQSGNSVVVSWLDTGSYTLQQNSNLADSNSWATSGFTITTANGTNSITITPPTGNLFFRLKIRDNLAGDTLLQIKNHAD